MKLEQQKEALVMTVGEQSSSSTAMSLDLDSHQMLMQMLSKNLYSDPIGSTVRECTSNALDSHKASGSQDPVIVSLYYNGQGGIEFSVEDFGVGLDEKDVENIISKYGKSTKRNSNIELGMMGLGFKSPLAYSSSFYFVCRKNGVERKYVMYEGEDVNTIDLMYESKTSEKNGVKVIVPVKTGDGYSFYDKIKEQLCYFEDVYFNVDNSFHTNRRYHVNNRIKDVEITNDFKIYRAENYQHSEMYEQNIMHLCLSDVYYPIDFQKLGIKQINIPIALRFGLQDGVFPTPNRESIKYSIETKKIIIDKIKAVADDLMNLHNSKYSATDADIKDVFHFYNGSQHRINIADNIIIYFHELLPFTNIKLITPKIKGIELLNLGAILKSGDNPKILHGINAKYIIKNSRMMRATLKNYNRHTNLSQLFGDRYFSYNDPKTLNVLMKDYLRDKYDSSNYYKIVKIEKQITLKGDEGYIELLNLKTYQKKVWRQLITEFNLVRSLLIERIRPLEKLDIPQDWIKVNKRVYVSASKKLNKSKGQAYIKFGIDLARYNSDNDCKFESTVVNLDKAHELKSLVVYTDHDSSSKINNLYDLSRNQSIKLATLSNREITALKKDDNIPDNFIEHEEFMKGKTKPFKRIATAYIINQLMKKNHSIFNNLSTVKQFSKSLYDKLVQLRDYENANYSSGNEKMYKAILEVAEAHNLFDENIMYIYNEISEFLEKHYFLNTLLKTVNIVNENQIKQLIKDLFRFYRFRMNYEMYLKQEELTDKTN